MSTAETVAAVFVFATFVFGIYKIVQRLRGR